VKEKNDEKTISFDNMVAIIYLYFIALFINDYSGATFKNLPHVLAI
jgi:hypothetical protein